jgi:CubicO group peptidase (beta-lactamase class C family)
MTFLRSTAETFRSEVLELQKTNGVPNFILSLIMPDTTLLMTEGPATNEHTLFPIGSMSKAFAATVVARLVDQGKLDWNDSIHKYIKITLPNNIDLTISQLLSHFNPFPESALTQASEFGLSLQELWDKLQYIPIASSYKFSYQNVLFSLIAGIAKNITGKNYEDVLRDEIFIPLGMLSTTSQEKNYLEYKNKATPHIKDDGANKAIPYSPYWHTMGPPSCVSTSLADLTIWLKFNLQIDEYAANGKKYLLSEKTLLAIQTPVKDAHPPYAKGWWKADEKGLVLCHTGSVTGFESAIAIIPSLKVGIALCANLSGNDFTRLVVNKFMTQFLNEKFNCVNVLQSQMTLLQPKIAMNKFVGDFLHPILGNMKVTHKENQLSLEIGKSKTSAALSPISLLKTHGNATSALSQLADHHCFQIKWLGNMEAAGKIYYDEDKIAFVENARGDIEDVILYAEYVSPVPVTCQRVSLKPAVALSIFNNVSSASDSEESKSISCSVNKAVL